MYQPGEMPLPTRLRPRLRRRHQAFHQETRGEAASSTSQLKAAVLAMTTTVEEEVQTNETMEDLNETRHELDRVKETWLELKKIEICGRDCLITAKKQGQELEHLRQECKEQSERLGIAKKERPLSARSVPRGQLPT